MLYYLFDFLDKTYDLPGAGLFQFITFRAAMAVITSLLIATVWGKKIIKILQDKQMGETIRDLGLQGQSEKAGTPTMGGLIIILATLVPVLLFAKLDNIYVILLIVTTLWMGAIGFLDDYLKKFKNDKDGLPGKFKVIGQVGLGVIVGATMFFHSDITVKTEKLDPITGQEMVNTTGVKTFNDAEKTLLTTMPFVSGNEINYEKLVTWAGDGYASYAWLIFIPIVIFIITAVSNGANLTDGIDGLAAGSSAIIGVTLAVLAFISGNLIFSDYLGIMFIPNQGELVIYAAAFAGACIGFLWYNSFPAQVFMGDTGSLALGGVIAVLALMIRKELVLPILCGIFLAENLSVMIQVSYFKYTKKKYGEGRRVFLMSPLHHHYQKLGYAEPKIVTRFWIVGIMLAIFTIITFKLR